MNKKAILLGGVIVILGVVAYAWPRSIVAPKITVTSPTGGETWQPGEEHQISWTTQGIPPSDKISVTIRRIPPPPLAEEGQEFDPIIFTDLPNTGTAQWKISPMYPSGTYVLGLHAYETLPITTDISDESAQFTITHPKLSADIAPLYSPADWNATEAETFIIGTTTYSGTSISSSPIAAEMDPGSIFTPFERYYDKKLKALGWETANDLAAGGHVGGQNGYRKNGDIILTRFHIDYHNKPENAPSECPCDVTLSLFSTGK